ncbi:MAG: bifunctional demethylmenaquinone methyltransferase/2-methoxy-6-polyprenyl-1,4-benzoquinol methylase UbiE [Bacteroidota bacterium]|jgi:demethylmenaquinone methyltransferase/2-methoxy-6-polyprenyl-1,4-benzoquinol methylase
MGNYAHDRIVPDQASNLPKKEQVAQMFNEIAHKYDFLNRFLSIGIDIGWRKQALRLLKIKHPQSILDVATGTADLAIMSAKLLSPKEIIGIDISSGMLEIGREKVAKLGLQNCIQLQLGDSEALQQEDNRFDAVTVSFGVRNFQHLEKGLSEILRVLKPEGQLMILEFSKPTMPVIKEFYNVYMNTITPGIGGMFSKSKKAYQYLNESVQQFPEGKNLLQVMEKIGFKKTFYKRLTFGICTIYIGEK